MLCPLSSPPSGIVHWQPPAAALQAAAQAVASDPSISSYGPADGMPALREALMKKIQQRNGLSSKVLRSKGL